MKRRRYLAGLGGTAGVVLAGCLGAPPTGEPARYHLEILVQNNHDRAYDARVAITDAAEELVFENGVRLSPGTGRGFGDDLTAGVYTIEIHIDGRLALRSYWETDTCDVHQSEVVITADGSARSATRCAQATTTATGA